jgi:hypothetical protein
VAADFPHKVLKSAIKCIFTGEINLPLNRMPVTFLAEISANSFVSKNTHTLWRNNPPVYICTFYFNILILWQIFPPENVLVLKIKICF